MAIYALIALRKFGISPRKLLDMDVAERAFIFAALELEKEVES